ncbi:D-isomer specific 2-hydroxyacid dehydrogenase [Mycena haematopus]|nr:D-isomer specific 2-hydroxyacid dehydrogenase [Mycena haematopus]
MASLSSRPSLAILDDYLDTAASHFAHITSDQLHITTFKDTLTHPVSGLFAASTPKLEASSGYGPSLRPLTSRPPANSDIPFVAAPGLGRTEWLASNPPRPNIKKGGVVGLGRLGAAVARIAHLAWGMRVVCWSASLTQAKADAMAAEVGLSADEGIGGEKTFRAVSKDELLQSADVVSLHYVLSTRSRGLVGTRELALMKRDALLVNASRGALIDQPALLDALEHGRIRGVALDTYDVEPLPLDSPWRRAGYWGQDGRSRVVTTPHMGYVDEGLMNTWYAETAENVERWLAGKELLHRLA